MRVGFTLQRSVQVSGFDDMGRLARIAPAYGQLRFTGAPDALEQRAGFLAAVSPGGRIDVESPVIAGSNWQISSNDRLSVKKYPLCFFAHRAVDAMLDVLKSNPVTFYTADAAECAQVGLPNSG